MDVKGFIQLAVDAVPILIQAEQSTVPIVESLYAVWKSGADPTDADVAALQAIYDSQSAIIDAPIPGEEP